MTIAALVVPLAAPLFGPSAAASSPGDGDPVLTPIEGTDWSLFVFLPEDYEEREYFLDGSARSYPEWDGQRVSYRTRVVVRTPKDPEAFSGTILVDWRHPITGGPFAYAYSYEEIHRRGHAFVGVSAHQADVDSARERDPARYGSLNHPGDAYSFDIYSQAAWLLKNAGEHDPLAGLREGPDIKLIGTGTSGSSQGMIPYTRTGALRDAGVYDSLMIVDSGGPIRFDLPGDVPSVPVVHTQPETFWSAPPPEGRPGHPLYTIWWVAGTGHVDYWFQTHPFMVAPLRLTGADAEQIREAHHREAGQYGERAWMGGTPCSPPNMFPKRYAINAVVHGLDALMRTETPLPDTPEFVHDESGLVRDADGNVLGGVRLPPIDVPVAGYNGLECYPEGTPNVPLGLRSLLFGGSTTSFNDLELRSRYPTHADYIAKLSEAIEADVAQGYLMPEDGEDLLRRAEAIAFRWVIPLAQ